MLESPQPGERYQHYKGSYYRVISRPRDSFDGKLIPIYGYASEETVWYQSEEDGQVWVRSLKEWDEQVILSDQSKVSRFTKILNKPDLDLNQYVKVKLSQAGQKYLYEILARNDITMDENGLIKLQLWDLIGTFGQCFQYPTLNPVFKSIEIQC